MIASTSPHQLRPSHPDRISAAALKKSVDRLYKIPKRNVEAEETGERCVLHDDALQSFFERNYTRMVNNIRKKHQEDSEFLNHAVSKANPLLSPKKKLGDGRVKEKDQHWVENMYELPLKKKEVTMENLERKFLVPLSNKKVMTTEQEEEAAERLFRKSREHREAVLSKATSKVYGQPSTEKRLSSKQTQEMLDNLYTKARVKKEEALREVETEYMQILPNPKSKKLSAEEMRSAVTRLSAGTR
eukprot:NODE_3016_length_1066_cov_25.974435_g2768_i0.p1 GENE.NODE_3016_length_1066_cov_25.974435_g2768_i0~~NODE_3016_length_1066_cov_25.974435_g2768_i0.p1  ORF type:complete len:244 (-),score=62.52 NODE_3016_length_1066_cov_25.974435_g2768_i0:204-935(-)